jgi:hypothetical protein
MACLEQLLLMRPMYHIMYITGNRIQIMYHGYVQATLLDRGRERGGSLGGVEWQARELGRAGS